MVSEGRRSKQHERESEWAEEKRQIRVLAKNCCLRYNGSMQKMFSILRKKYISIFGIFTKNTVTEAILVWNDVVLSRVRGYASEPFCTAIECVHSKSIDAIVLSLASLLSAAIGFRPRTLTSTQLRCFVLTSRLKTSSLFPCQFLTLSRIRHL